MIIINYLNFVHRSHVAHCMKRVLYTCIVKLQPTAFEISENHWALSSEIYTTVGVKAKRDFSIRLFDS